MMIYGEKRRDPLRYFGGIGAVVLLHVVLIYALINGLASKVVKMVVQPMQTRIVHEVRPPPPPPPKLRPPPPPRVAVPPPPFVPIPVVAPPAPRAATITAQSVKPVHSAPIAPPAPKPRPAPPRPVNHNVAAVCSNLMTLARHLVYPSLAMRDGIYSGQVVVEFTIDPQGHPKDFAIRSSSNHVFNEAAINVARQLQCTGQGVDVRVLLPIGFQASN